MNQFKKCLLRSQLGFSHKFLNYKQLLFQTTSSCHTVSKNVILKSTALSSKEKTISSSENAKTLFDFAKVYAVNHFCEPNTSWNETIAQARSVSKYNMDLYQRMMTDYVLKKFLDYRKLEENKIFQEFISHYFRTYNYQITGIITIMFTKIFLNSKDYWPELFSISNNNNQNLSNSKDHSNLKLNSDIIKLAECYDSVSYGFYFHDTISNLDENTYEKSLRNLLLLLGDYFLVKSSFDVASFSKIDLYKIYVQTISKYSEGESLSLSESDNYDDIETMYANKSNLEIENDIFLNNDQVKSCNVQLPPSLHKSVDLKSLQKLISYCYFTGGHLVASSMQSAFYLANFSSKAQMLAFEFGKNVGMALKISNQLSALFVTALTKGKIDLINIHTTNRQLPVNHLNLSYFAKFPNVNAEVMQYLLEEYVKKSLSLLNSLSDPNSLDCLSVTNNCEPTISVHLLTDFYNNSHSKIVLEDQNRMSKQSVLLLQSLTKIINEIQSFNKRNFELHSGLFHK